MHLPMGDEIYRSLDLISFHTQKVYLWVYVTTWRGPTLDLRRLSLGAYAHKMHASARNIQII